jgi:hypothetical protein
MTTMEEPSAARWTAILVGEADYIGAVKTMFVKEVLTAGMASLLSLPAPRLHLLSSSSSCPRQNDQLKLPRIGSSSTPAKSNALHKR